MRQEGEVEAKLGRALIVRSGDRGPQRFRAEERCSGMCSKEAQSALEDKDGQRRGPDAYIRMIPVILMNLRIIADWNEMTLGDRRQPTGGRDGNSRPREE